MLWIAFSEFQHLLRLIAPILVASRSMQSPLRRRSMTTDRRCEGEWARPRALDELMKGNGARPRALEDLMWGMGRGLLHFLVPLSALSSTTDNGRRYEKSHRRWASL